VRGKRTIAGSTLLLFHNLPVFKCCGLIFSIFYLSITRRFFHESIRFISQHSVIISRRTLYFFPDTLKAFYVYSYCDQLYGPWNPITVLLFLQLSFILVCYSVAIRLPNYNLLFITFHVSSNHVCVFSQLTQSHSVIYYTAYTSD
jgi:hypothetical protein